MPEVCRRGRDPVVSQFLEAFIGHDEDAAIATIGRLDDPKKVSILHSFVVGLHDDAFQNRCQRALVHRMVELRRPREDARITHYFHP